MDEHASREEVVRVLDGEVVHRVSPRDFGARREPARTLASAKQDVPRLDWPSSDPCAVAKDGVAFGQEEIVEGDHVSARPPADLRDPRWHLHGTPLLKGSKDDRCQCAHWGYVIKGKMTYRFADRDEVYEAGDAYYAPPGHIPVKHEPGTEIVMFSPAKELLETEATMMRNMKAMMGG